MQFVLIEGIVKSHAQRVAIDKQYRYDVSKLGVVAVTLFVFFVNNGCHIARSHHKKRNKKRTPTVQKKMKKILFILFL